MTSIYNTIFNTLCDNNILQHVICPSADMCFANTIDFRATNSYIQHSVDERSAGYLATGMAAELDAPVAVWCAGDASFRNLTSALTEAFYRRMPIIVITVENGNDIDQTINPTDILARSYTVSNDVEFSSIISDINCILQSNGPVLVSVKHKIAPEVVRTTMTSDILSLLLSLLPLDACVHLGTLHSHLLKTANTVIQREVRYSDYTTVKDGRFSILVGSSVVSSNQLHVGVFTYNELVYDMNMLGNRHIGDNLCLIITDCSDKDASFLSSYAKSLDWNVQIMNLAEDIRNIVNQTRKPTIIIYCPTQD